MISSAFTLKDVNIKPDYLVSTMETRLEHNYYFNNSLKFLTECQKELLGYKRDFYRTVLESSDNPYIITESFNDVLDRVKEIIRKILAYIESLVKRFLTEIPKLIKSDKYLIKMRKEIDKFPKGETFTISGCTYTFDDKIPVVDVIGLDINKIKDLVKDIDRDNVEEKIVDIKATISKLADFEKMDSIRGDVLNQKREIPESSFRTELFAVFRDGKHGPEDMVIGREEVLAANKNFSGYDRELKAVRRLQKEIDAKYRTLEKQVEDAIKNNMTADGVSKIDTLSSELSGVLDRLLSNQVEQIRRISNVHVLAVAAKLDAYNDLVVQDRNILYRALNIVQSDINNTRAMKEASVGYDYTSEGNYKSYILEKYFLNENHKCFVEECLALSESNIPELKAINEDLKMNAQNWFRKLKELVKSLFEKFMMKMNGFFQGDKSFLEKYKDVILTKKVDEYTLNDMPDYEAGIANIKKHTFKSLDIKKIIGMEDKQIQQELLQGYETNEEFVEYANKYFLCDNDRRFKPKDVKNTDKDFNMNEIYTFCVSAKESINSIKSTFDSFYSENEKIKNEVVKALNEKPAPAAAATTTKVGESVDMFGNKLYYSNVLESYITEEEVAKDGASEKGGEKTPELKLNPDRDTSAGKHEDLKDKSQTRSDEAKNAETQAKENSNAEAKKVEEAGKAYLNTIKAINLAKITAFERIYKEYMKILRYHVRKATGSMGSTSNFDENDVNELKEAMKQYATAKDDQAKDAARDKIINIYKSRKISIDARDVQNIVNKNAKALGIEVK